MACNGESGMAALELMVVVVIILALFTVAIPLFLQVNPVDRIGVTNAKLLTLKQAIVGDWQKRANKARASFGFVGDLGVLPATLNDLLVQGAYPNYQLSNNVWFGWRGPYLYNTQVGGIYVALRDSWGNAIAYNNGVAPIAMELRSMGADGVAGNADDQVLNIYNNEVSDYVYGTIWDRSKTAYLTEHTVTIWFANGNAVNSLVVTTAAPYHQYSTRTDAVSNPAWRRIPLGIRYLQTTNTALRKLASINGGNEVAGDATLVDFRGLLSLGGEVLYLKFEDSGNLGYDSSAYHHDGTAHGAVSYDANGKVGHSAFFDYCNHTSQLTYISVSDNNDLDLTTEGTIAMWISMTVFRQFAGLAHKGTRTDFTDEAYSLQFWNDNRIYLMLNNNARNISTTNQNWATGFINRWRHLTVVWGPHGMAFYLDGALNASNATAASTFNSSGDLIIGAQLDKNLSGYFNIPFCGRIDEVRLWKREFSASDVAALYNSY